MIVACVRTGQKYSTGYVHRLRAAVARHLRAPHRFVCLTDDPRSLPDVECLQVRDGLYGWWGKMQLFEPSWRADETVVYLDLDSIVIRDLAHLAAIKSRLALCASFTVIKNQRIAVTGGTRPSWHCKYGSMCMVIGPALDGRIWKTFLLDPEGIRERVGIYGDQLAIEQIEPNADLLQPRLPKGFFLGYRDLDEFPDGPPKGAAIIVFAGKNKPHNTECKWAREAWEGVRAS